VIKNASSKIGAQYAREILVEYNPSIPKLTGTVLLIYLVNECPDHGYIVDYDLLKNFCHL